MFFVIQPRTWRKLLLNLVFLLLLIGNNFPIYKYIRSSKKFYEFI